MATTRPGAYCMFPVLQSSHAMHQTSVWSRVDTPTRRRDGLQQPAYAWLVWRVRRLGGHGKAPSGPRAQMGLAVFCSQSRTTKSPNSFSTATASPGHCNRPPLLRPDLHLERACRDCCVPKLARASASLGVPRSSSRLLFNLQHPFPHPQHPRWRPSSCASTSSWLSEAVVSESPALPYNSSRATSSTNTIRPLRVSPSMGCAASLERRRWRHGLTLGRLVP
jgi:hypothetical protein